MCERLDLYIGFHVLQGTHIRIMVGRMVGMMKKRKHRTSSAWGGRHFGLVENNKNLSPLQIITLFLVVMGLSRESLGCENVIGTTHCIFENMTRNNRRL